MNIREARQSERPDTHIECNIHGGRPRPETTLDLNGKPAWQEAHSEDPHRHICRSMPEALRCIYGKHDRARGPARAYSIRDREAGPSRKSRRIRLGSPIMWDAHGQDIR